LLWTQEIPSSTGPAAIDANNLYLAVPCPGVFGMDRFNGYAQWWYHGPCTGGSAGQAPVVHQGKVWGLSDQTGTHDGGWVARASDGALVETFRAIQPPAFKGNVGLFLRRGLLSAMNLKTHALLWRFRGDRQLATAPLIVGRYAYLGTWSGRVYGIDMRTGRRAWTRRIARECPYMHVGGLAAGGGMLLVPCDGRVFAFASARRR
jgi:outer membrane protein assembly factor BamB